VGGAALDGRVSGTALNACAGDERRDGAQGGWKLLRALLGAEAAAAATMVDATDAADADAGAAHVAHGG
jgi:hypothetical protein